MVACLPNFQPDIANRVFVDVMNEPDSMSIRWEESGGRPGAAQLYLGTADALWATTPNNVLFMFEGACFVGWLVGWLGQGVQVCSTQADCVHHHQTHPPTTAPTDCAHPFLQPGTGQNAFGLNWGNGFITDRDLIASRGLSDANPFFQELVKKPYADKVGALVLQY